jgi:imidazoleglycerol-phosphate dehydratase
MTTEIINISRKTAETEISAELNLSPEVPEQDISIGIPFLEHMLHAASFHGGFGLKIQAGGDTCVDPHHLVEDIGLVLGESFRSFFLTYRPLKRYGHAVIPMDDALSEAAVDVCERPFLVYKADYPQLFTGSFDISLLREFFLAFANKAQLNLHLHCRYGLNSHHMAESLFKAFGKAVAAAYQPLAQAEERSTKGVL